MRHRQERPPLYYMKHTWGDAMAGRPAPMQDEDPIGTVTELIQLAESTTGLGKLRWDCYDCDIAETGCVHCYLEADIQEGTIKPPPGYASKEIREGSITSHCRKIVSEPTGGGRRMPEYFVLTQAPFPTQLDRD
jgi:hypothetical protein